MAVTAGGIFPSLHSTAKLGKQSHCLLKSHECVMETNVFPFVFLGEKTSLVLPDCPKVILVNRTLPPDILVGCEGDFLADSKVVSAL